MSYTTHNFQPGRSLTAEQLNDMDNAIATLFNNGAATSEESINDLYFAPCPFSGSSGSYYQTLNISEFGIPISTIFYFAVDNLQKGEGNTSEQLHANFIVYDGNSTGQGSLDQESLFSSYLTKIIKGGENKIIAFQTSFDPYNNYHPTELTWYNILEYQKDSGTWEVASVDIIDQETTQTSVFKFQGWNLSDNHAYLESITIGGSNQGNYYINKETPFIFSLDLGIRIPFRQRGFGSYNRNSSGSCIEHFTNDIKNYQNEKRGASLSIFWQSNSTDEFSNGTENREIVLRDTDGYSTRLFTNRDIPEKVLISVSSGQSIPISPSVLVAGKEGDCVIGGYADSYESFFITSDEKDNEILNSSEIVALMKQNPVSFQIQSHMFYCFFQDGTPGSSWFPKSLKSTTYSLNSSVGWNSLQAETSTLFPFSLGYLDLDNKGVWSTDQYSAIFTPLLTPSTIFKYLNSVVIKVDPNNGENPYYITAFLSLYYPELPQHTNEGYRFGYWADEDEFDISGRQCTSNSSIKAVWYEKITVTLDPQDGSGTYTTDLYIGDKYYSDLMDLESTEEKYFKGWSKDTGGTSLITDADVVEEGVSDLYGIWDDFVVYNFYSGQGIDGNLLETFKVPQNLSVSHYLNKNPEIKEQWDRVVGYNYWYYIKEEEETLTYGYNLTYSNPSDFGFSGMINFYNTSINTVATEEE